MIGEISGNSVLRITYFNKITRIHLIQQQRLNGNLQVAGYQTLIVYDVLGNEVITLVDEYRNAGIYDIDFDASNLSSGIYFYQLKAGDFISTKKMILLK